MDVTRRTGPSAGSQLILARSNGDTISWLRSTADTCEQWTLFYWQLLSCSDCSTLKGLGWRGEKDGRLSLFMKPLHNTQNLSSVPDHFIDARAPNSAALNREYQYTTSDYESRTGFYKQPDQPDG